MGGEGGLPVTSRRSNVTDPNLDICDTPCLPDHHNIGEEKKLQHYKEGDEDGLRVVSENTNYLLHYIQRESEGSEKQDS